MCRLPKEICKGKGGRKKAREITKKRLYGMGRKK
jgi:hypothetical protein